MARYLGPKLKLSRRIGSPIEDVPKHTSKRQLTPPGMHGYRGRRLRDYGIRLNEKQKLRHHYSVLEKQFRRYIAEASRLLQKHKGARVLAGGHSLLPAMKIRLATARTLVDIGAIKGLSGIKAKGKSLEIGATTTHAEIAASPLVKRSCPILAEAAAQIGDLQVRNRGTIGGSIAHADPAADLPTVLVALGATIQASRPGGARKIPADKFFVDLFTTALKPGEIVTSIGMWSCSNSFDHCGSR